MDLLKQAAQILSTTSKRKDLLKKVLPPLEERLKDPSIKRAFIGGSFSSSKPNPSDVDIFLQRDRPSSMPEAMSNLLKDVEMGKNVPKELDLNRIGAMTPDGVATWSKSAKRLIEEGRKRYGNDYHWTRIKALGPVLAGAGTVGAVINEEDEAEAAPLFPEVRKAYNTLRKKGGKVLYHSSKSPEEYIESIKKKITPDEETILVETYKPRGSYFTDSPKKLYSLVYGDSGAAHTFTDIKNKGIDTDKVIRGVLAKDNKTLQISEKDLQEKFFAQFGFKSFYSSNSGKLSYKQAIDANKKWTEQLKRDYDVIHITDMFYPEGGEEFLVLNPKKIKLAWKNKLVGGAIGLGGAKLASDQLDTLKAEASVKQLKGSISTLGKISSGAEKVLRGKVINGMENRGKVVSVLKTPSPTATSRWIVFGDGSTTKMDKEDLNAIMGAVGVDKYQNIYKKLSTPLQRGEHLDRALNRMRTLRGTETLPELKKWNKAQIEKIRSFSPELLKDFSYVKDLETGETYYTNTIYARDLQKRKRVKIIGEANESKR